MKIKSLSFVIACLALCLIPTIGFFLFPTTETSENRAMSKAPEVIRDGKLNLRVFDEFSDYYNEHMGLRNYMVTADARVQETVFGVSNVDGVIVGTDGWLYYSATLNDYQGTEVLSERALYNLAHNLSIVEDYLTERGTDLLVIIPPNKNTLYGEHMPYYDRYIVEYDHSAKLLKTYLEEQGVPYLDLFELLESQDEVLYQKRDSHWNTKGADLVYSAVLDALGTDYLTFDPSEVTYARTHSGDLDRMLHSFYGSLEEDYTYALRHTFRFSSETADVTDGWLASENPEGKGTILMFRDSFADNLIPFFSETFASAYYSKGIPGHLERYLELYAPEYVVIEKVERNITDYLFSPPIISPVTAELPNEITIADTDSDISLGTSEYDPNYYLLTGTVDPLRVQTDTEILISINGTVYRTFQTGDCSFALYLKKADVEAGAPLKIRVFALTGSDCVRVLATEITPED